MKLIINLQDDKTFEMDILNITESIIKDINEPNIVIYASGQNISISKLKDIFIPENLNQIHAIVDKKTITYFGYTIINLINITASQFGFNCEIRLERPSDYSGETETTIE